jgi:hypothetical protein
MVEKIAAVPGVDVIFAASSDLSSFSGFKQREPQYEALVTKIHDATMKAGLVLAGPIAWKDQAERPDFRFFQGPGPSALIRMGADVALGQPPRGAAAEPWRCPDGRRGTQVARSTESTPLRRSTRSANG